jgi:Ca2+-binding RTX toxin-like protein
VQSAVSFVLGNFIETLQLTGAAATDGTGNAQANAIRGNNAANTLSGADGNDTLQANAGDDKLYGGSGADLLQGGDGKDLIVGGIGVDRMTGDNSVHVADTFVFLSAAETGAGAGSRDVITDFDAFDRLDLSAVDANALLTGQQHFSYIGTAAFSAVGQLRIDLQRGYAVLEGDLNGDGVADFQIELTNVSKALDAGVLIL